MVAQHSEAVPVTSRSSSTWTRGRAPSLDGCHRRPSAGRVSHCVSSPALLLGIAFDPLIKFIKACLKAGSPAAAFVCLKVLLLRPLLVTTTPSQQALADLCGGPGQPPWKSQGRLAHSSPQACLGREGSAAAPAAVSLSLFEVIVNLGAAAASLER